MWIISCDIVRSMEFESDFVFRGFITSKQVSNSPGIRNTPLTFSEKSV